ncbi:hypothetical protein PHYBOEH_006163 [Phytophthora boehmeriae]|uniref:RxLR effector protein n=1 Tax=Phytophthora boehmeriae TaxID=109152 RepID=A0A8T1WIG1_9STRA|nr:hypothetical protein PHYBOEH_006163 [Phytophthora boehmeriae]
MRYSYVLLVAITVLLANTNTASAFTNSNQARATERGYDATLSRPLRSLRRSETHDVNKVLRLKAFAGVDEEERGVISSSELAASLLISIGDAKILRAILKHKDPSDILDKLKVPFQYINKQRVYSKYDPEYQKYVYYLKYANDYLPEAMWKTVPSAQ